MNRRTFLAAVAGFAGACALRPSAAGAAARALAYADMHSHIGILGGRANVREAMARNGMLVIARKIVADGPVIRRIAGKSIQQVREPAPGELASRFDAAFDTLRNDDKAEGLIEIDSRETLEHVMRTREPAVALAAEGADFLDGNLDRLEAFRKLGLIHVQLVHYRVSEVGDISTERPVHRGLTAFGKQLVAACNRLGVLVDVAHCTSDGIQHALEISTKPVIYSHGHVSGASPYWTHGATQARAIHRPLAKQIAEKGGVIGIWPLGSQYRSLEGYAGALLDAVEALGPAHVGVGSDMFGLPGTVMPGYEQFPALDELLAKRGVRSEDIGNLLGGNYLRVLLSTLGA